MSQDRVSQSNTSQTSPRPAADIRLSTHGEKYGNWMPVTVLCAVGTLAAVAAAFAVAAATLLGNAVLTALLAVVALVLLVMLCWMAWIRRQYAFGGGNMMDRVHGAVLSHLDFDGTGRVLDVGCGSGALSIRAALTWPEAQVVGVDLWPAAYAYSRELCEANAESEGVADRCTFRPGDARALDLPDESFDAVVSNYVYHNINGTDKRALVRESLRVLRRGGVFALNDEMKPHMYGDLEDFAQELRDEGFREVRVVDTATEAFGSHRRAALMMLGESRMLVGRK